MTRVLMVCLGNICRSPAAEVVLRDMAAKAGCAVQIDSCGTRGWHIGDPPYGPMIKAAAVRGYDLTGLKARAFVVQDFDRFDVILAMDASVQSDLERQRPKGSTTGIRLLSSGEVPDPYYTRNFDQALDLIEQGCHNILKSL
jgi:protein-tyrosine phosphatase